MEIFIFPAIFSFLKIAGNAGTTLHTYNIGIGTQNAISICSFMARILSFAVHTKENKEIGTLTNKEIGRGLRTTGV
jgi:hypothetical protein